MGNRKASVVRNLQYPSHMADQAVYHCCAPRTRRVLAAAAGALALSSLAACEKPAITWADKAAVTTTFPSPLVHPPLEPMDSSVTAGSEESRFFLTQDLLREVGAQSLLQGALDAMPESREAVTTSASLPAMHVAPAPTTTLGDGDTPLDALRCARSLRIAAAPGRGRVAVWWTRADRGRVLLHAAWQDATASAGPLGAWRGPIVVDSLDQGPLDAQAADRGAYGCVRPAPSVVVDTKNGYVHVAYALAGPEGAGVFYAHQMDPRSAFESPVAIVYGDKLGDVRVDAAGDVVAVAYEDPNSGHRTRVALAISRTAGHLFEDRLMASTATMNARDPSVSVRGRAVVVGWSELGDGGTAPVFRIRRARVRE